MAFGSIRSSMLGGTDDPASGSDRPCGCADAWSSDWRLRDPGSVGRCRSETTVRGAGRPRRVWGWVGSIRCRGRGRLSRARGPGRELLGAAVGAAGRSGAGRVTDGPGSSRRPDPGRADSRTWRPSPRGRLHVPRPGTPVPLRAGRVGGVLAGRDDRGRGRPARLRRRRRPRPLLRAGRPPAGRQVRRTRRPTSCSATTAAAGSPTSRPRSASPPRATARA